MPETYFEVRWPDGQKQNCYSPSSVISQYLDAGKDYSMEEFVRLSETALKEASERVRQKFGYYCSSAADQLGQIHSRAQKFDPKDLVSVISVG